MANTYPITEQQMAILDQFTCERLTDNEANWKLLLKFGSYNGGGLVANLQRNGWVDDAEGTTAYYVIKNPEKQIVMFFSLRCGVLFDPHYINSYVERFRVYMDNEQLVSRWQLCEEGDQDAYEFFLNKQARMGDDYDDFIESLRIKCDKLAEENKKVVRVGKAYSAIELVEFCVNDRVKRCWKNYGMDPRRKLGETMFWKFIVPTMLQINRLIGCEYVYLFAADNSRSGRLINYYRNRLHFDSLPELGVVKPSYDFSCTFMGSRLRAPDPALAPWAEGQERNDLAYHQEEFFNNFNMEEDDDYV